MEKYKYRKIYGLLPGNAGRVIKHHATLGGMFREFRFWETPQRIRFSWNSFVTRQWKKCGVEKRKMFGLKCGIFNPSIFRFKNKNVCERKEF